MNWVVGYMTNESGKQVFCPIKAVPSEERAFSLVNYLNGGTGEPHATRNDWDKRRKAASGGDPL